MRLAKYSQVLAVSKTLSCSQIFEIKLTRSGVAQMLHELVEAYNSLQTGWLPLLRAFGLVGKLSPWASSNSTPGQAWLTPKRPNEGKLENDLPRKTRNVQARSSDGTVILR
jgi:hypothetical protein